jgi:hypothetical protein
MLLHCFLLMKRTLNSQLLAKGHLVIVLGDMPTSES